MPEFSRRRFLKRTGSAAAGAMLASTSSFGTRAVPPNNVAGIQLYTVNESLENDPTGTLEKLAAIGYKEVETAGFANRDARGFRKLLADARLSCPSAHLDFGLVDTGKLLEEAAALGAQYVVSSVLAPPSIQSSNAVDKAINSFTADDFKEIAALANRIGQQAKGAGLQYAYHNHNFEFRDCGGGRTGYSILLSETDPELVKLEADCGWMTTAGVNPIDYFHRYPNRYRLIHVKDFTSFTETSTTLALGAKQQATELGRGHIDYKPILVAAKQAGVEHFFVEQDPPIVGMTALEAARIDYNYLHAIL
jgi:sugar phosphate isomerase/epimerase